MLRHTVHLLRGAGVALFLACSTAAKGPSDVLSGATATTDAGLVGCSDLTPGCYSFDGSYPAPVVMPACSTPGSPASGSADSHCKGVAPQVVEAASCDVEGDAGPPPQTTEGLCGENGPDYGATMYGTEGDDDDCKYHVTYSVAPICQNEGTYFVVTATYLAGAGGPLTSACTFAEVCLNDTHLPPASDSRPPSGQQQVVEGPKGTYTIGPVLFDAAGIWTVRFHFNEECCDVANSSPHGHAAFFVDVP